MEHAFALHLSDIRLLQTLRLLESSLDDHSDQQAVKDLLDAISDSRRMIGDFVDRSAHVDRQCCA